ncbi:hypothetical protein V6N13_055764 [Hibiscus sabdariffa]|uniref:Uncharacterized protein n=1 Tax=Hibiscus sabdariffa TaxID=183260 RepID=A0ABR2BNZ8_9ROSI
MAKIGSVALALAVVLSILLVARGTGHHPRGDNPREEKAFRAGIETALVQMEEFGIFDKDMKSELAKVDFHHAYNSARAREHTKKTIFVATFVNTMGMMERSGAVDKSLYEQIFPDGGKTLTPELELALTHAYQEAQHHEQGDGHPKHDL